jgi:hypothetical protein
MPYGTVNADVIQTSTSGGVLGAGNASIMKNRIINGAMVISQYNGTSSVNNLAGALTWSVDRWKVNCSAANKFTLQQNAGSVTPPVGFVNYLGLTSSSAYSVGSSDYFYLSQTIEGYNIADLNWGTANAKTITVSFWVRASVTGTYGGIIINSDATANYPFSFTVNSSNTWQYITITVVGPTFGTWNSTNGSGLDFRFDIGHGSDYTTGTAGAWSASFGYPSGTVKLVANNAATLYITGVQLEVGSSATGFEYRNYTTELQLAQRYYWKNTSVAAYGNMAIGSCDGSTIGIGYAKYPVTMRAVPTVSYSTIRIADGTVAPGVTSISYNSSTYENMGVAFVASGGGLTLGRAVQIQGNNSTTAFIDASAEL